MKQQKSAFSRPSVIAALFIGKLMVHLTVLAVLAGALAISQAHKYASGMPEIWINENLAVQPDTTVPLSDFASAENVNDFRIGSAKWCGGDSAGLSIAGDGQSLTIGDRTGTVEVHLAIDKKVAEATPSTVYIHVEDDSYDNQEA